jgi:acetoacetyl-CoA synthetase
MTAGDVLWTPAPDAAEHTRVGDFMAFLRRTRGLELADYDALWRWSVDDLAGFWSAIWDYFEIISYDAPTAVLSGAMPGARWFDGATLNYAEHVLRVPGRAEDDPVVLAVAGADQPDRGRAA